MATISENGQTATATGYFQSVYAVQGFQLAGPQHRADNFQGTILYYFEVTGNEFVTFLRLKKVKNFIHFAKIILVQ
jgi:hypothetical protein